ncbi:MAG: hypothetical protein R3B90_18285 [Planctomycetaceae bacterium]
MQPLVRIRSHANQRNRVCGRSVPAPKPTSTEIANRALQAVARQPALDDAGQPLRISGIYPHLAAFNGHGECGIGAVVPWADRLWWITYPPHMRTGSNDKLYSTDESLLLSVHPESVGGTHAARMIHEPSEQLFIGPYAIRRDGAVRAMDVTAIPGRYTAWAQHLEELESKLYLYDMEGPIWEVDVETLAGERKFVKTAPGWHGKGAYTGQGRLVISNNGESSAAHDLPKDWELPRSEWATGGENVGGLAEFDGDEWRVVERRQFVDVTGPGGIRGTYDPVQPLWAMGWDRRSVILAMCDDGKWSHYRLPKASHAMDPTHGWYTEWPRIREVVDGVALMCMHGMFYEFPLDFAHGRAFGIRPLATHLRYVPDFCTWNGQLVLAADDTSVLENPMAGQSQSNLWFGKLESLRDWGVGAAYGGPWLGDRVEADTPSDPYLFAGFKGRVLHLASGGGQPVKLEMEVDYRGDGQWESLGEMTIPESGYHWIMFDDDMPGEWIRFRTHQPATISAYLHYASSSERERPRESELFAGLATNAAPSAPVIIRPAAHDDTLLVLRGLTPNDEPMRSGPVATELFAVDGRMEMRAVEDVALRDSTARILTRPAPLVQYDAASAIVVADNGQRLRLPRVEGTTPYGRDIREVQSERSLAHIGNTFYEVPRGELGKHVLEYRKMRPIASHKYGISDFCSWRGLLVLAGARADAPADGHVFGDGDGGPQLWFGAVDDLWQLGAPVGVGGPWHETAVSANEPSDPYIMTGFDKKTLTLRHDSTESVTFDIQVDYSNRDYWKAFESVVVPAGEAVTFEFPRGYSAHWVRLVADRACQATATFVYGIEED